MRWIDNQVGAILSAQWRMFIHRGPRAAWVFWLMSLLWYGLVALGAWGVSAVLPALPERRLLQVLDIGLLVGFLWWQIIPVLLVSSGLTLDLRSLLVYPVPRSKLFGIEVLLRFSTGVEVLILMAGAARGLWSHPGVPKWGPLLLLLFVAFNMFLSAGVRDLLTRLLARRGIRELLVFGLVLLSALPQVLLILTPPSRARGQALLQFVERIPSLPFPWTLTARAATGHAAALSLAGLAAWVALAAWFGYRQFLRGLSWDASEVTARERASTPMAAVSWADSLYRLPSLLLPDPIGAMVEKEIRSLARAPRFRLVFFMGFSFGLLIWFPLAFGRGSAHGAFADNFLVWVSLYSALLLGDALFWNNFGFDRHSAQVYYVVPVKLTTVFRSKNISAVVWLLAEVTLVAAVCLLLPIRLSAVKVVEAYAVTLMACLYLLSAGNLASTYFPRPINPAKSWRNTSSGKVQVLLLIVYPLIGIPITLAYLARYAFESQWAFYLVLAAGYVVGAIVYWVSLESAVEAAQTRREQILANLSRSEGPIGG